ncbi:hypothetical protein PYCCODRAFT_552972 [Trametes coccinea BRFM310]|uniref:Uncharacterized protein n=1 Tax=Trametes coccinea (strain BRFM310) TaxID=1353009 RepID=A0A1Y2IJ47_TRAC3|nr:hypothetical protein PYCCODRAFT_552972 [Trametes coccinea BRFM310]
MVSAPSANAHRRCCLAGSIVAQALRVPGRSKRIVVATDLGAPGYLIGLEPRPLVGLRWTPLRKVMMERPCARVWPVADGSQNKANVNFERSDA